MKFRNDKLAALLLTFIAASARAAVHYVDVNSASPTTPYTDWATAATNIQDAASAAVGGDLILVTNGVYQTGGNAANGRIFIHSLINVQSVNGPAVTIIDGSGIMRCALLSSGVTLSGFTLANGAALTHSGGGVYCLAADALVVNCIFTNNSAVAGGGALSGTFSNCTFVGNIATNYGGGVYGGTINQCSFVSNSAGFFGGGAFQSTLVNCSLTGNSVKPSGNGSGGGAYSSILTNCAVIGNRTGYVGGGAGVCTLINCTVASNLAASYSGGTDSGTLKNCIVYYNSPDNYNSGGSFTNCCTTPLPIGPGSSGNITNAPAFVNPAGGDFHLQLGSPCINAGNNSYIAGSTDLDGNLRIVGGTVDMGACENQHVGVVHFASLSSASPTSPYTSWATAAINIQDAVAAALAGETVVAGDGVYSVGGTVIYGSETNRVALTNAITLLSLNGPGTTVIVGGTQTRCVYVGSNSVLSGFTITNGQTGLSGDLVREQSGGGIWCEPGGSVANCLVISNFAGNRNISFLSGRLGGGIYGGAISNCLLAGNFSGSGGGAAAGMLWNCTLTNNTANLGGGAFGAALYNCVLSSNVTVYNGFSGTGGGVYQCILHDSTVMGNQAGGNGAGAYQGTNFNCLITGNGAGSGGGTYQSTNFNCIISGNAASTGGGGAYGGMLYSCVLSGNTATSTISSYGNGGGLNLATLYNCLVFSNTASAHGGGVYQGTLYNCTVSGNSATNSGGGIYGGSAYNSIVYYNSAPTGSNWSGGFLFSCCTLPHEGDSNGFTNAPLFVNLTNDFHLQSNSPCINAGENTFISVTNDLDGHARIVGGTVDIGAYEFQSPSSVLSYVWAQQYGLPTDGTADYTDADHDGMNNWQEWKAGTIPTDATSVLQLASPSNSISGMIVAWQSVLLRHYDVQRTTNLATPFSTIATDVIAWGGTTSYTDTTATNGGPYFYRVGIQ